jgi:hypothetical protein
VALHARVDEQGRISHWQHALWANGYSTRPGRAAAPALLAATQRELATAMPIPVNPPLAAGGGAERNAVPAYKVPNLQVLNHRLTVMPLRTSAMRALGAFANVFAIESFVDELALKCGQDPLAFRQQHLEDPRALAVLEKVTSQSSWWGQKEPEGVGQGLAWARYKNSGAWCAAIARVQVSDQVRVLQIDLAVDVGMVVDLDGVINQMEGGAVQATSAGAAMALGGALRDGVSVLAMSGALGEVLVTPITAYSFVYHLEMYLLFVVLVALGPMLRASRLEARAKAQRPSTPSTPFGLAQLPG